MSRPTQFAGPKRGPVRHDKRPAIIDGRTAPTAKTREKMKSVHFRPIQELMGALPSAPKNAPAWRTETMFEETSLAFAVFPA